MNTQLENLMEELVNRDFIFTEETDAVVYEKNTREGSESVTIFPQRSTALHERWNKNGVLSSAFRYELNLPSETVQLLNAIH